MCFLCVSFVDTIEAFAALVAGKSFFEGHFRDLIRIKLEFQAIRNCWLCVLFIDIFCFLLVKVSLLRNRIIHKERERGEMLF